ncbi:hypothetical protein [Microbulbifer pacificus]|uniref:hypothetical protein n=1 Tax=Microbulbifer pacificus TaxID=407164 RepID=UPI000CF3E9EA|nr:hypothetical protein [Microbulbifer pacificus]
MISAEQKCEDMKVLEWNFPEDGREINLVLKPKPADARGVPTYWQLNEAGNPGEAEAYGNMDFKIKSGAGFLTLNVTLDPSEFGFADLEFVDFPGLLQADGIVPLTQGFRHQFYSRVVSADKRQLKIKITDLDMVPDNFAFLWFCYSPSADAHFVSGDPKAVLTPQ